MIFSEQTDFTGVFDESRSKRIARGLLRRIRAMINSLRIDGSLNLAAGSVIAPGIDDQTLWPLAVYFAAIVVIIAGLIGLSFVLGQRHRERATGEPYESGIVSTGSAQVRFDIKFYLVAVVFLVFDLEAAFLYAWAVAVREAGWAGYVGVLVFVGVLAAALIYLWRLGLLDWGKRKPTRGRGDWEKDPEDVKLGR